METLVWMMKLWNIDLNISDIQLFMIHYLVMNQD